MFVFGHGRYKIGNVLKYNKGMIKHSDIYSGNENVRHFISDSHGELLPTQGAVGRRVHLRYFSRVGDTFVHDSADSIRLPVEQIVANAESKIGLDLERYKKISNYNEHFARRGEFGQLCSEKRNDLAIIKRKNL